MKVYEYEIGNELGNNVTFEPNANFMYRSPATLEITKWRLVNYNGPVLYILHIWMGSAMFHLMVLQHVINS